MRISIKLEIWRYFAVGCSLSEAALSKYGLRMLLNFSQPTFASISLHIGWKSTQTLLKEQTKCWSLPVRHVWTKVCCARDVCVIKWFRNISNYWPVFIHLHEDGGETRYVVCGLENVALRTRLQRVKCWGSLREWWGMRRSGGKLMLDVLERSSERWFGHIFTATHTAACYTQNTNMSKRTHEG